MSDWLAQYTTALDARARREAAHKPYIQAYSKLADRTALLEEAVALEIPGTPQQVASTPIVKSPAGDAQLFRLQTDLGTAQRERADLAARLSRLEAQLTDTASRAIRSEKRAAVLEREKHEVERKLRDQSEEIRGKNRLVTEAHDEMVGLNLQLNMAEERAGKLKTENEELVRRWMERMGMEAERMNQDSQWT